MTKTQGGRSRLADDGYLEGAPELVAEIAASSAAYDLYDKKTAYRRNEVKEYIVWQVLEPKLDWFILREGVYESLVADNSGIIRSEIFPGLWLDSFSIASRGYGKGANGAARRIELTRTRSICQTTELKLSSKGLSS